MVQYFEVNGSQEPADFNVMVAATLARECGTDITGMVEQVQTYQGEVDFLEFAAKAGAEALNAGAKREGTGKSFTKYDLYDAFTRDLSLAAEFVTGLIKSLSGEAVFSEPTKESALPKKRKKSAE